MATGVPPMALRRALINLHKTVLDWARRRYEREHGQVTSQHMLHLLMHDEQFEWLRPLSELIVRLDEALEDDLMAHQADISAMVTELRALIAGGASPFSAQYLAALQDSPDVVLAHRDVLRLMTEKKPN